MKKVLLPLVCLPLLVLALSETSYGWQGRMSGMGDPYGLVADESDFLIHTADIADGKGITYYGNYSLTYTKVTDWNYHMNWLTTGGVLEGSFNYDGDGHEYKHSAQFGVAFPLGVGRMGVFLGYDGKRGEFDGNETGAISSPYDLSSDRDNFSLRLLYGLPVGSVKLGGEFQLARHQVENENFMPGHLNYPLGTTFPQYNLSPFQLPYDSSYWEAMVKGSLAGQVGRDDLKATLKGGLIFSGDNSWQLTQGNLLLDFGGDVKGWRAGGDIWLRHPLAPGLTLPFLLRFDYQDTTREGSGLSNQTSDIYPYKTEERSFIFETGGGVEKEYRKGTKTAAGIYYSYLKGESDLKTTELFSNGSFSNTWSLSDYPKSSEHRIMLRLTGEMELSSMTTLRMGITPFYGWVKEDYTFSLGRQPIYTDTISMDGHHWGINAAFGGTIRLTSVTLEPFISMTWQKTSLDGDGNSVNSFGTVTDLAEMNKDRNEWGIGAGLSVLF